MKQRGCFILQNFVKIISFQIIYWFLYFLLSKATKYHINLKIRSASIVIWNINCFLRFLRSTILFALLLIPFTRKNISLKLSELTSYRKFSQSVYCQVIYELQLFNVSLCFNQRKKDKGQPSSPTWLFNIATSSFDSSWCSVPFPTFSNIWSKIFPSDIPDLKNGSKNWAQL